MDKVFLGAQLLERLNYIQDRVDKYNRRQLLYSEEFYGILRDLTDGTQSIIDKPKSEGWVAYTVISGTYRMNARGVMRANTHLHLQ